MAAATGGAHLAPGAVAATALTTAVPIVPSPPAEGAGGGGTLLWGQRVAGIERTARFGVVDRGNDEEGVGFLGTTSLLRVRIKSRKRRVRSRPCSSDRHPSDPNDRGSGK